VNEAPRLFGTSGIRGIFVRGPVTDPVGEFIRGNLVTPQLAFLMGRAVADLHRESGNPHPVEVWQDVRESGHILAGAVIQGLADGNCESLYRGIAPTTLYTVRYDRWVIVVTASHNPAEFNGIKIFCEGRPIVRAMEQAIEARILTDSQATDTVDAVDTETALEPENDTRDGHIAYFRESGYFRRLDSEYRDRLDGYFLPLDLAHGAAACPADTSGRLTEISAPAAMFLALGIPVMGYGCAQDSQKTNEQIGAAYAYGETADPPGRDELKRFAAGRHGYGAPAERILLLPVGEETVAPDSVKHRLPGVADDRRVYCLPIQFNGAGDTWVIHVDDPELPAGLKEAVEKETAQMIPLPGCMVDGDADRILITTEALAATPIPYLTGDGMIRFFIETAPPGTYSEVAFTVESGLSLDVALERLARKFESRNQPAFVIRKVTVGDRAIIDCFMDTDEERCIGGEPSGHIIFCEMTPEGKRLTDDPFMTYLILLNRILDQGGSLDNILDPLFMVIPEVYCARKPDSRAETGLTATEKSFLTLWKDDQWGVISPYAEIFIPEYVAMYSEMVGDVFHWGAPLDTLFTNKWSDLLSGDGEMPETGWEMPLARVRFESSRSLDVFLYLDPRPWAGPEVIRLIFRAPRDTGETVVVGEGVFRNSGTSPKNAGYHKLWPENPLTRETVSEQTLIEALKHLAARRAAFTNEYVKNKIRHSGY